MMPEKLKEFLKGLSTADADEIDQWLDGDPDAIENMRDITYPRSSDFFDHPPESDEKAIAMADDEPGDPAGFCGWGPEFR